MQPSCSLAYSNKTVETQAIYKETLQWAHARLSVCQMKTSSIRNWQINKPKPVHRVPQFTVSEQIFAVTSFSRDFADAVGPRNLPTYSTPTQSTCAYLIAMAPDKHFARRRTSKNQENEFWPKFVNLSWTDNATTKSKERGYCRKSSSEEKARIQKYLWCMWAHDGVTAAVRHFREVGLKEASVRDWKDAYQQTESKDQGCAS